MKNLKEKKMVSSSISATSIHSISNVTFIIILPFPIGWSDRFSRLDFDLLSINSWPLGESDDPHIIRNVSQSIFTHDMIAPTYLTQIYADRLTIPVPLIWSSFWITMSVLTKTSTSVRWVCWKFELLTWPFRNYFKIIIYQIMYRLLLLNELLRRRRNSHPFFL